MEPTRSYIENSNFVLSRIGEALDNSDSFVGRISLSSENATNS